LNFITDKKMENQQLKIYEQYRHETFNIQHIKHLEHLEQHM